jgi:hypothetical protein
VTVPVCTDGHSYRAEKYREDESAEAAEDSGDREE